MSILNAPHFRNEKAAYKWVEARVWPQGPVCPKCGTTERISAMKGKSTRMGCYKCYECRKPFTVKVGTIFESSHIPLHIWLQGMFLMCSSKKGISTNQLHRTLGITLKSAWFMSHRIREAMKQVGMKKMGGGGSIVEADETYFGDKDTITTRTKRGKSGHASKRSIVALVERGGQVRSFHVNRATKKEVQNIIENNVRRSSRLHTDESRLYADAHKAVDAHESVNHSSLEYVRGDVHCNSAEGVFGLLKRGMKGVYHHCSEKHLHRYLSEFDFRYNSRQALGYNDEARTELAVCSIIGKRLTYRTTA